MFSSNEDGIAGVTENNMSLTAPTRSRNAKLRTHFPFAGPRFNIQVNETGEETTLRSIRDAAVASVLDEASVLEERTPLVLQGRCHKLFPSLL